MLSYICLGTTMLTSFCPEYYILFGTFYTSGKQIQSFIRHTLGVGRYRYSL